MGHDDFLEYHGKIVTIYWFDQQGTSKIGEGRREIGKLERESKDFLVLKDGGVRIDYRKYYKKCIGRRTIPKIVVGLIREYKPDQDKIWNES